MAVEGTDLVKERFKENSVRFWKLVRETFEYLGRGGLTVHPTLGGNKVPHLREKLAVLALVDVLD